MTDYYPDAITTAAEQITLGFNVVPGGDVSLTLFAVCTSPVGPIRINISPEQAADLYRSLHNLDALSPQQIGYLSDVVAAAAKKEN